VYGEDDVQVRQTDVAGNVSATATQEFTTDMSSPVLTDFTPIAQATDIATDSNITVTFNEAIIALEGNLTLSDGGSDVRTIDIHDTTQVTISNNILTINPTEQLQSDTTYSVNMEAGVISDIAGNSSLGVNSINFTTEVEPPAYFTVNSIGVFHDINQNGRYDENESYLNTHDNTQDTFSNIINDIADVNNESVTLRLTTVNMDTLNLAGFGADDLLIVDVVSNYTMKFFTNNNNIMEREYANFVYSINEGHASRTHTLTGFELNNSFVFKIFTQNTEGKHFLNWSASDSNRTIGTFAVWSSSTDSVLNFGSSGSITNSGQYSDADTATGVQVIFPDISIPGLP
jgi:hypothetical protein